ncbi:hypothetical protein GCM10027614_70760 [Micromonospora vulcania]
MKTLVVGQFVDEERRHVGRPLALAKLRDEPGHEFVEVPVEGRLVREYPDDIPAVDEVGDEARLFLGDGQRVAGAYRGQDERHLVRQSVDAVEVERFETVVAVELVGGGLEGAVGAGQADEAFDESEELVWTSQGQVVLGVAFNPQVQ